MEAQDFLDRLIKYRHDPDLIDEITYLRRRLETAEDLFLKILGAETVGKDDIETFLNGHRPIASEHKQLVRFLKQGRAWAMCYLGSLSDNGEGSPALRKFLNETFEITGAVSTEDIEDSEYNRPGGFYV